MSATKQRMATISAGAWQSDPVHSSLAFEVQYLGAARFRGELPEFEGQLRVGGDALELAGTGRVASLRTKDENLDAHLQSPDFFDADRHPEIRFRSTDAKRGPDGDVTIEGELTIKGTTRPALLRGTISEPVADLAGKEKLALDVQTIIDRTDFGVSWNAPLPGGGQALADDVELTGRLVFVKESD